MGKYTDDEIRAMPKITAKIAADYLGTDRHRRRPVWGHCFG